MNELREVKRHSTNTLAMSKYPGSQPHWVADMSFGTPETVLEALKNRIDEGHFSYSAVSDSVYEAILHWCTTRYHWDIQRDWVVIVPTLMCGMEVGVKTVSSGQPLFYQRPNYSKLITLGQSAGGHAYGIELIHTRLPFSDSDLEAIKNTRPSAVILCNPANPTGTVSTREQLMAMADCVRDLDTVIISDEAHADFILDECKHIPAGSIEGLQEKSITLLSPSKTFNLAGIAVAYAVIPSRALRERFIAIQKKSYARNNALGLVALEHAYFHCSDWIDKLVVQLKRNQRHVHNALRHTSLEYYPSQATYLAWIDARQAGSDVFNRILHKGISVCDGHEFGAPGWIRLNFACPEKPLKKATDTLCELFGVSR